MRRGTTFVLEVRPSLPRAIARLAEVAGNLWYAWDRPARELFSRLDPQLWQATGHSPTAFLQHIDEQRLVEAAHDPEYISTYHRVLSAYDSYHGDRSLRNGSPSWRDTDLIAYFCAEFGFHESLPIYSGGLGILAADHCKAASDMRLSFVGVGLLYRQGYFAQTIDPDGSQAVTYTDTDFGTLPATPVMAGDSELRVNVDLPGRAVVVRVWHVRAGNVNLYFLDTDVPPNSGEDRGITYRLYGGDRKVRIEQEIVLGIGGARALAALGVRPSVWHINEGHAAFLILERIRGLVQQGYDFTTAYEAVAANVVFTTHTAVPAGHDQFEAPLLEHYFRSYCTEVGIEPAQLLALGRSSAGVAFDMTALAVRGSRFHNAVSQIHGEVTSHMLQDLWPQIPEQENPVDYVTNGVHVPTFLAPEWADTFERFLGAGWGERLEEGECAARLLAMPDHMFWSVHQYLKSQMLRLVRYRVSKQHFRNNGSEAHLERMLRLANPDDPTVLTIGFARRFATYKRAALLFRDRDWLRNIVSAADRPVLFIFAGKAHPADAPGQELIREIARMSRLPEFEDKVLLVEGYDLRLSRRLVAGVDVWLNNPIFPVEASGTSGMKAGMNGVLNLSVLDGWWGEGYQRGNGWAIKPAARGLDQAARDREEARTLYELLQDHVVPLYYARGTLGYSPEWIRMAKQSIATLLPRFNATRMLSDYLRKFYLPAAEQGRRYAASGLAAAAEIRDWKSRVRAAWPHVSIAKTDSASTRITYGDTVHLEVAVQPGGLRAEDITVELLLERTLRDDDPAEARYVRFQAAGNTPEGALRYKLDLAPELCGRLDYSIRAYPWHPLLTQRFELGLMVWV